MTTGLGAIPRQTTGETARRTDNRWTTLLLDWVPFHGKGRRVGHPPKRGQDHIVTIARGSWNDYAADEKHWQILGYGFAHGTA